MRVVELATDLGVSSKVLLNLLRSMRISAMGEDASISVRTVASGGAATSAKTRTISPVCVMPRA